MGTPLIISVSGLRGLVGETLTFEVVRRYMAAFAEFLKRDGKTGSVLVSYDGRASGKEIVSQVHQTLATLGIPSVNLGVAATPTTGFLVAHTSGVLGGVQITASHNPHPWNGIKLFNAEGRVIPGRDGAQVKALYEQFCAEGFMPHVSDAVEIERRDASFQRTHLDAVLQTVDEDAIRSKHFRVVLDSNHGSGSVLGGALLEALGCTWRFASETEAPDGLFVHTPEPTEENLRQVCGSVPTFQADVGFCQDPDADRLAVIAANGTYIGEEYTVALCADAILRGRKGPIVTNCSTSLMTHDIARQYGVPSFFSPVGEANVIDAMRAHEALFGGEGNGGPIDPQVGWVRDSFVGMAQILHRMATTGESVLEGIRHFPSYAIVKRKYTFPMERLSEWYAQIQRKHPEAAQDTQDGLRLAWEGRWMLVRPSNTEPIVRIIAEAETTSVANELIASIEPSSL